MILWLTHLNARNEEFCIDKGDAFEKSPLFACGLLNAMCVFPCFTCASMFCSFPEVRCVSCSNDCVVHTLWIVFFLCLCMGVGACLFRASLFARHESMTLISYLQQIASSHQLSQLHWNVQVKLVCSLVAARIVLLYAPKSSECHDTLVTWWCCFLTLVPSLIRFVCLFVCLLSSNC